MWVRGDLRQKAMWVITVVQGSPKGAASKKAKRVREYLKFSQNTSPSNKGRLIEISSSPPN